MDRLVSLAPSVTTTVRALGAGDRLVGVTAHDERDGAEVVGGWLTPDLDRLDGLAPDLVLTADPLQREIRDTVEAQGHDVFHHEPSTLDDVIDGFGALAAAIGQADAGRTLVKAARERIDRVRTLTPNVPDERPVVYCEEWPEPPMAAGNWVPEAVEVAGGRYPFVEAGERSSEVDPATVVAAEPVHVVIHHCGFSERADADNADRWGLDADVHVLDDALLNQPSPRLVDGIERLASVFHGVEGHTGPVADPSLGG